MLARSVARGHGSSKRTESFPVPFCYANNVKVNNNKTSKHLLLFMQYLNRHHLLTSLTSVSPDQGESESVLRYLHKLSSALYLANLHPR